ncbi:Fun14p KNAG_0D04700 [Huiozyma naganishii CBS 8797]|uniref:FUN14 domain-containing protein n=1 Tax=Huiozyma naganishii (strain ATCC MYA-139 / BCRC 22969 / CBS 8797 / KCTC 17520 / NBRC 10181 / NCYC 3082 / Yp74L-3) TaxID=1071383 RepID=J7R5S7_HUIN7|nr:hypothetical protein KNAG_0D04700 [Kazachstania naganishii CBS 8797]CCK70210.1 hypothetical protein KNAG_0D04700 [Kazachstania naganishii CBS 8797]
MSGVMLRSVVGCGKVGFGLGLGLKREVRLDSTVARVTRGVSWGPSKSKSSAKVLMAGAGLLSGAGLLAPRSKVMNEVAAARPLLVTEQGTVAVPSHAQRKAVYKQLCLGSILGVVCGVVMVKVSGLLVYTTVFGLLLFEWLRARGLVDVRGEQLIKFGKAQGQWLSQYARIESVNVFRASFLGTLVLTYWNSN